MPFSRITQERLHRPPFRRGGWGEDAFWIPSQERYQPGNYPAASPTSAGARRWNREGEKALRDRPGRTPEPLATPSHGDKLVGPSSSTSSSAPHAYLTRSQIPRAAPRESLPGRGHRGIPRLLLLFIPRPSCGFANSAPSVANVIDAQLRGYHGASSPGRGHKLTRGRRRPNWPALQGQ